MVTIVDYKQSETSDGKKFYALIVQGGVEMVLNEQTGRYYLTARQASVTSTFNEQTCKGGLSGPNCPERSPESL
jgi:hypothetical protein